MLGTKWPQANLNRTIAVRGFGLNVAQSSRLFEAQANLARSAVWTTRTTFVRESHWHRIRYHRVKCNLVLMWCFVRTLSPNML